nr:unnamed protein product [Spirometra erinaceieuropaei]
MSSPVLTPPPSAPIDTSSITPSTFCIVTVISPTHTPSSSVPTTTILTITGADTDTANISHLHYPRTFTPRIGQVGHLRIHCTETGEPTCTRHIRLHCPHCSRTFIHLMGPLGHLRVHENLR